METFAKARAFVDDPGYSARRRRALSDLNLGQIDAPIRDIVCDLKALPHCFSLQCCYGHFATPGRGDNFDPGPLHTTDGGTVRYRIAYLALCLRPGDDGARLREALARLRKIDAQYVQFGSPSWFWDQHPNAYAVQVEPERFKFRDEALIGYAEALRVQRVRNRFYAQIRELVAREVALTGHQGPSARFFGPGR